MVTHTHMHVHTLSNWVRAHTWQSYTLTRQAGSRKKKKSVRQVAAVRLTAQNKVAKFRKTMFVFLSHTISARACARALSAFLPTSMDNSCCYCCSLTGWDLWKIAKFVKARKNSVQKTNRNTLSQNSRIKAVYKKMLPLVLWHMCVCVCVFIWVPITNLQPTLNKFAERDTEIKNQKSSSTNNKINTISSLKTSAEAAAAIC